MKDSHLERKTCIDESWKQLQNENWFITKLILGKQLASDSDIQKGFIDSGI